MSLRSIQSEVQQLARRIAAGELAQRLIVVDCVAGGGKSQIPPILATELLGHVLDGRRIDHVCWVTPRLALQIQAVDAFIDPYFRQLLGHQYLIRQSTNDRDPSRTNAGHSTTYQAITQQPAVLAAELERKGYILFLDECHHVYDGSAYEPALRLLVERAALVVLASGTLMRNSRRQAISFLPYTRQGNQRFPIQATTDEALYVRYSMADALGEHAIKQLEFELLDAHAEWYRTSDPQPQTVSSLLDIADEDDQSAALFTVLETEWARGLLERTVASWLAYRQRHSRSKLLVVAKSIQLAREYLRELQRLGVHRADIATSDDSVAALRTIDHYKKQTDDAQALDALVTVAMAYEGLDVPSITHLACLTHIRSLGWILQMLARAQRVDRAAGPWATQRGFIFAPRDDFFENIVATIMAAQAQVVIDMLNPNGGTGGGGNPEIVTPLVSGLTGTDAVFVTDGQTLDSARVEFLRRLQATPSVGHLSLGEIDAVLQASTTVPTGSAAQPAAPRAARPNEVEDRMRRTIEQQARARDARLGVPFGSTNTAIFVRFGKAREEMTVEELQRVLTWMSNTA